MKNCNLDSYYISISTFDDCRSIVIDLIDLPPCIRGIIAASIRNRIRSLNKTLRRRTQ